MYSDLDGATAMNATDRWVELRDGSFVRAALHGPALPRLTPQERAVLDGAADGLNNKAIARRMFVEPRTVERHIGGLFKKLFPEPGDRADIDMRTAAVIWWREKGRAAYAEALAQSEVKP